MKKFSIFALLISILGFVSPAQAYAPPPATSILLLLQPRLTISLPPNFVFRPDKFKFADVDYTFSYNNGIPSVTPNSGVVSIADNPGPTGDIHDNFYVITVKGIKAEQSQSLKNLRLTFDASLSTKARLDQYEAYLDGLSNGPTNGYYSDNLCSAGGARSHICFISTISLRVRENLHITPVYLKEVLPVKSISVAGNVGGVNLSDFVIDANAIAVGDSVNVSGGSASLNNYFTNSSLKWGNGVDDGLFGQKANELYQKKSRGSTVSNATLGSVGTTGAFPGTAGSCSTWYLNSPTVSNPCNGAADSQSSPPEGKLWNITTAGSSSTPFIIGRVNGPEATPVTISGSGTLAFDGDLYINAPIACSTGTRLGIITTGNIYLRTNSVGCGAFVSLGGSIFFDQAGVYTAHSGQLTGIFVAKGNLLLPKVDNLTDIYRINYDNAFATNPTILFRELLQFLSQNLS